MWKIYLISMVLIFSACEALRGPTGPQGPQGERGERGEQGFQGERGFQGPPGDDLSVQVETGTILNRNYTDANPSHAAIPLANSGIEPTVLFLGIENDNGVYDRIFFSAVIWGGDNDRFTVPGTSGWYLLVLDSSRAFVGSNYQVKFVQ